MLKISHILRNKFALIKQILGSQLFVSLIFFVAIERSYLLFAYHSILHIYAKVHPQFICSSRVHFLCWRMEKLPVPSSPVTT